MGVVASASVADEHLRSYLSQHVHALSARKWRAYEVDASAPGVGSGALQRDPIRLDGGFYLQEVFEGQQRPAGAAAKNHSSREPGGQGGPDVLVHSEALVVVILRQLAPV